MSLNRNTILAAAMALSAACAGPSQEVKPTEEITPTCARVTGNMRARLSDVVGHSMGTRAPTCDTLCNGDPQTGLSIRDFRGDLLRVTSVCPDATQTSMHNQFCAVLGACACAQGVCR